MALPLFRNRANRQWLLENADLDFGSIYYSAIPRKGAVTPTFTRATSKRIVDSWGRQVTCLAGEVPFPGARRVRNMITISTADLNTAWSKDASMTVTSGAADPDGGTSAYTLTCGGAGNQAWYFNSNNATSGNVHVRSIYIRRRTGTGTIQSVDINGLGSSTITGITSTWTRISFQLNNTATSTANYMGIRIVTSGDAVDIYQPQVEDVTGQSVQTAGEYVSVGVQSAPAYHGSCVDGVKCFPTDLSGNLLPTTATYDSVTLNGVSGTGVTTPDSSANTITGDIDLRCKASLQDWSAASTFVGKWTQTGNRRAYLLGNTATGQLFMYASTTGANAPIATSSVTHGITNGSTKWVRCTRVQSTGVVTFYTSDDGVTWSQLGTPQTLNAGTALYNASAVVEFPTTNATGNAGAAGKIYRAQIYNGINGTLAVDFDASRYSGGGTTLTGSTGETWTLQGNAVIHPTNIPMTTPLIELAATQLIATTADIRDMTTASWTLGATMTRARTSVGLDGSANSATRLTGGAVAATNTITYTLVAAASSRTYSAYVKRITGTGPVRLTQDGFATNTDISSQLINGSWVLVQLNQSQLNAVMGFKIDTNGDAIDVDFNQFEAGASATSRIATGSAARNADQLYYTGALIGNLKSIAVRGFKRDAGFSAAGIMVAASDGTSNNHATLFLQNATQAQFQGVVSGGAQWNQAATNSYITGTLSGMAQSFATNDIKMAKDGVAQTQDTTATVPTVTRLEYGMLAGAFQLNGYPGVPYAWTRPLLQSELNVLTA